MLMGWSGGCSEERWETVPQLVCAPLRFWRHLLAELASAEQEAVVRSAHCWRAPFVILVRAPLEDCFSG